MNSLYSCTLNPVFAWYDWVPIILVIVVCGWLMLTGRGDD